MRSGFSGHYYAGSVYVGSNASATSLGVDIGVPQDTPQATDFYYVLLSVWDNAKSYDQIGLVNNNGSWEVSYSYTSACAGSYTFSTSAFGLDADTTYLFEMQLVSNNLQFSVSLPSGGTLWSDSAGSAATSFVLANTFYCNGGAYYDYSNYEEVYGTSAPVPPYSFFFTNNTEDSTGESNWITYVTSGAPSGVNVVTGGTETVIENEPFGVSAAPKLIAEVGSFARNYSETVSVAKYGADTLLTPSISGSIPRARVSILPSNGSAPVTFNLTVMVNASSQPGSGYGLEIEVTDTHGVYARIEVVVQLNAQLAATTPGARPTSTDVNRTVVLTESPSGGSGTYGYLWSGLPAGCPNGQSTLTCTPQTSGSFSVTVEVSDSLGFYSNSTVLVLTVHPALGVTAAPNVTALDVGQTVEFVATPSGGSGGLSYAWSPVGTAACSASGPTYACLPHSSGTLSVTVSATDIAGSRVSASASSVVSSDPSATLRASRTTVDAGRTDTLTVTATGGRLDAAGSGGVTNYSLSWTGLPTSCTAGAALSAICSWDAAGTYPIEVRVIDANGFLSAPASLTVTVVPSLSVTLQESPSQALAGQTVLISAVTLGGSGALHFAWSGLPSGCSAITGANLTCQVPGSGTFDVKVTVTDGAGGSATASSTLTVAASFLGLPELEGYAVLGGVLGIVAVSAATLYLVSRRRRRAPPSSEVPAEPDVPAE